MIVISLKIFNVGFFGDLEILINVWNFLFLFMVLMIRITVIIFSFSYMRSLRVRNFIFLYVGFIIRILWLVINNNFYWIIFGWDGLGVVSFLLIVFYINHERINNGLFTLFQNRIGDLFFVLFILGLIDLMIRTNIIFMWGLLFVIIGRSVKSAQFPFNSWLLAAIRAPTPISSLVHSSTLVVAGVYILLQFSYCLVDVLIWLKFIRLLRLIIRRFGLLNERDIKKLIAYSTISHVSLIIYLLSFELFKITYFHLNIHAIFKSLIFICFGFLILSSYHAQDKRLVTLINLNPLVKIIYYFSCLCLAGLPFLRGFFSKDLIVEKFMQFSLEIRFIVLLILFLRIRIYYRIKLIKLISVQFSLIIIEKNYIGILRICIITLFITLIINLFISLTFRIRLEVFNFKISIYLLILIFGVRSLISNINWKINLYDKEKNFKELWVIDFYLLDKFIYWNFIVCLEYIFILNNIKLILLINWWVMALFLLIYYNISLFECSFEETKDFNYIF